MLPTAGVHEEAPYEPSLALKKLGTKEEARVPATSLISAKLELRVHSSVSRAPLLILSPGTRQAHPPSQEAQDRAFCRGGLPDTSLRGTPAPQGLVGSQRSQS